MSRTFIFILSLIVVCGCKQQSYTSAAGAAVADSQVILNVPLIAQQTDQWCWAASAEMIMTYHQFPVSQCEQANVRLKLKACCNDPIPMDCVQPGWPEYDSFNFEFFTTEWGNALTWEELKFEINNNRPISFAWGWRHTENAGHMMDAVGYIENSTGRFVAIHDPWEGAAPIITYEEFVSSINYDHWVDYYGISHR